ncbi:unannotated protein [freshwater metagenome]|uniref:Unannotated protein n=1 Tax=freshwater metagenome TaxID=449393 RepID=A0A6J7EDB6_9ZZZZ|nr:hypothetical protein [Actinomycetota bacterium]
MGRRINVRAGWVLAFVLGAVIATAGTATAAKLITGRQIKDGTISAKDLSKAVRAQLKKAGMPGPRGLTGPQGIAGPISGAAGGALSGTYPNPELGNGVVGTSAIESGAVTYPKAGFVKAASVVFTYDFGPIAGGSCSSFGPAAGVTIEADDVVLVSTSRVNFPTGAILTAVPSPPANIEVRICNPLAAEIIPLSRDYRVLILD